MTDYGEPQIAQTAHGIVEFEMFGSAPYIVVMHGTPGTCKRIMLHDVLLDAGFGTLSPSRPGYQGTPLNSGVTLAEQADAVAALLDQLDLGPVGVYGISGGGPSSIQLAARHPGKVKALMLECAISMHYETSVSPLVMSMTMNSFFMWLQGWIVDHFPHMAVSQMVGMESTLDKVDRARITDEILADPDKLSFFKAFTDSLPSFKVLRDGFENDLAQFEALKRSPFENVQCPTFVAHGTHDADVPFDHGEASAREIAGAEFCAVDKGFHLLALSDGASKLSAAQIAFFNRHLRDYAI